MLPGISVVSEGKGAGSSHYCRMAKPRKPCRTQHGSQIVGIRWRMAAAPSSMPSANRCARSAA